jgi:hypothetical protein
MAYLDFRFYQNEIDMMSDNNYVFCSLLSVIIYHSSDQFNSNKLKNQDKPWILL